MAKKINIVIAGIEGYTGQILAKLVAAHPDLRLVGALIKEDAATQQINNKLPLLTLAQLPYLPQALDVLLLATPTHASMELMHSLQHCPWQVIDLSGAFRLPAATFEHWYNTTHHLPQLLDHVHYGLSPWAKPQPKQQLIANPGCYATCALMALIPVLKHHLIQPHTIIIDAKSGVSGAGKKANAELMFNEMAENFFPYKIGQHQHTPEIEQGLLHFSQQPCQITLTTHMLPICRGISMTIYADATADYPSDNTLLKAIHDAYQQAYATYPLVVFASLQNGQSAQEKYLLALKSVVGTPAVHIAFYVNAGKVILFACLDNLLKGAASQAIENINALYDLPLATGLVTAEAL
jgi:N-acetyl-gamma-glutamyl-phosphate reductase